MKYYNRNSNSEMDILVKKTTNNLRCTRLVGFNLISFFS